MTERHTARLVTLAFVTEGDAVLLRRHPAGGDRFAGLWNGVGGHVEAGEDVRAAARREVSEEAGLDVTDLSLRGVIHESGLLGHAHVVFLFVGTVRGRALRPDAGSGFVWQPVDRIDELDLVDDVRELLPRLLTTREPLFVRETYDGGDRRLSIRVDEPQSAPGGTVAGVR